MITARQIVTLRDRLGLNQAEFAKLFDLNQATISRLENGRPLSHPVFQADFERRFNELERLPPRNGA